MSKSKPVEMRKPEKKTVVAVESTRFSTQKFIKAIARWVGNHVMPLVGLVLLAGLAVRGLAEYLPMLGENARLTACIVAVAFLLVAVFGKDE
jgi:hypothetical protein